jgi:ectoine hydroxylase-related dioxygenase (phytanoyl-CoA dioxygenase family)
MFPLILEHKGYCLIVKYTGHRWVIPKSTTLIMDIRSEHTSYVNGEAVQYELLPEHLVLEVGKLLAQM